MFVASRQTVLSASVGVVLLLALPTDAAAQRAVTPAPLLAPTVDVLVQRALERAPSLAARRERLLAAQQAIRAADALPDPMVEIEYQSFNFPRYTIGSDPGFDGRRFRSPGASQRRPADGPSGHRAGRDGPALGGTTTGGGRSRLPKCVFSTRGSTRSIASAKPCTTPGS